MNPRTFDTAKLDLQGFYVNIVRIDRATFRGAYLDRMPARLDREVDVERTDGSSTGETRTL